MSLNNSYSKDTQRKHELNQELVELVGIELFIRIEKT